ncbi:ATP-dependent nuclease [Flavobacterium psychrophilum]|nr:AAA family ATPase [Flavobacterium psychrophilum]EKT4535631.1 AAA family ATPase [Flavobacterium psychrophilum]EKT4569983.1 AAA family ATPase [Flavobacterium psychrophilum]
MIELKKIKIESQFKNLSGLEINFENSNGVTVLIGNNGSGKSNVLEAISSIFAGLYDNDNFNPMFKYEISYTKNDALINIKYDPTKSRNKYEKTISDDDPLPTQIISIYSGEEQRMWNRYYFTFYENFNKDVISGKRKFNEKQKMEFLNKYHWNITLVTMLASFLDISDIIQDKQISYISFHFKKHNIQNINEYDQKNSNEVIRFAKLIYESSDLLNTIKDTEIRALTFNDFTDLVLDTNIELFRKLSVSLLPKENNWKLIDKMEVFFKSDVNEDSFSTEELSEGQKKQLLIKFATKILADENSILLLDEPDSHIHISNKEKIKELLYEEDNKPFLQSIITTHSPTLTSTFNNENVFMLKKEDGQVKIVDKEQQEIIKDLFGENFSPQIQNMFLATNKPIILLVEGKHDKEHISNAFDKLANEYTDIQFDVFQMNSACNIPPMMLGLRTNEIDYKKLIIGIFDDDNTGRIELDNTKSKFPDNQNKKRHDLGYYAFTYPKSDEHKSKDFTVENFFETKHLISSYEEAFKIISNQINGNSIESINEKLKEKSKVLLFEKSKKFNDKEDFKHFRKLFNLIREINNLYKNNFTLTNIPALVPQNEVVEQEQPIKDIAKQEIPTLNIREYGHHKGYTSKKTWANFLKIREELLKSNPKIEFFSNKKFVSLYSSKSNFCVIRFRKNTLNVEMKFSEVSVKKHIPNRNIRTTQNGTVIDNINENEDYSDIIDMLIEMSKIQKVRI